MSEKLIIGEPGGPAGPFYSVVSQSGRVLAMQIPERETAEILVAAIQAANGDFNTIHEAGRKLGEILAKDFPESAPEE